jgi:Uma2 family endonuclease
MSSAILGAQPFGGLHSLRRLSVDEYHRMIRHGILNDEDKVELLDGYLVLKMPRNPPHCGTIQKILKRMGRLLPAGWDVRGQSAVTFSESEPEPDVAVVRGDECTYMTQHPGPADVGLIIEVAESSLDRDRNEKSCLYARAGIPIYWIVNLIDKRVEVRTSPGTVSGQPGYVQQQDFAPGDVVPLVLDGVTVASVDAAELLP